MSRVEAAAAMDRLPWLPDEPRTKPARRRGSVIVGWAAVAIAAAAGAGFWIDLRSVQNEAGAPARHAAPATTVHLPQARPAEPQVQIPLEPQVTPAPQPQVRPTPVHEVRIAVPHAERSSAREVARALREEAAPKPATPRTTFQPAPAPAPAFAQPRPQYVVPRPWPPRITAGAYGRLVQVGAFGSIRQAKRGWWYMARAYPAMAHLPAVVRPSSNSKGRTFYRFQVGTTSQAHSEVLCQRMEAIHMSCAVVGLPWKAKVER